jgi:hypothetical protein
MKQKLFVATPVHRELPFDFVMCLLELTRTRDLPFELSGDFLQGRSLISRARNWLTAVFLATDCTHLLFIDCDILFTPQDVIRLASHDEAIVGGFYPFKTDGEFSLLAEFLPDSLPDERGLLPVRYLGAGFLLVRRDVFERMIAAYGPEISYPEPPGIIHHDFWRNGVYRGPDAYSAGHYLNEDLFFQQNATDLGFKVYGDTQVVLKHIGTIPYPVSSETIQWDGELSKFVTNKET